MAKTGRELAESVRLADLVIEVVDARIPRSSTNPGFVKITQGRKRVIALNKIDLADPARSAKWKQYYKNSGTDAVFTNSNKGEGVPQIRSILQKAGGEKILKQADRGVINRPLRAMIVGIPNSGKSSLINCLASRSAAATGDRPGVTRRRQWFRLENGVELLDTPGVLWPKFDNEEVALHLAFTGAIKDGVYDTIEAAEKLLAILYTEYAPLAAKRYGEMNINDSGGLSYPLLEHAGRKRGFLLKGGSIDYDRTAAIVLDEFRAARIGRITLEAP